MRVLVVEDARALAAIVAEGLRDQGMAVDIAYDGLDAAAKLDVNTYDVVVLDRDLPRIHALARRQPAARARTLRAAGIELDPIRRTATRDGQLLDLSVKEFALLEALLRASPALPQHRGPTRTGLGRTRRPVHQHCHRHHRTAAPQARQTLHHHHHTRRRLPHHATLNTGSPRRS